MNPLLTTLRGGRDRFQRQREKILDRGLTIAGQTRDAGVDLLSRMELNADSWRRSLAARQELRRAALKGAAEGRDADLSKIELLLLRRVDRFLEEIALRVRAQIEKLGRLELSAEMAEAAEEVEAPKVEAQAEKAERAGDTEKKASKKDRPSARKQGSTRWTMPISGYDELNVKQIGAELPNLTESQLRTVREHEEARKNRVTVLRAIDRLLEG